ncbi:hypothetical protein HNY73_003328 [Argiope bruennichi]|uniref:Integrase catalytic domain-containing protein n=1 Tax=Argiope bruennichi TaxID=94029 RepID=A0A8T0FWH5_ARGBR|nr:hypothetical protein HNY73_003328 [Argiope bruennichi]
MATQHPGLSWTTYTKWLKLIPFPIRSPTVAKDLVQNWISRYGVPLQLHLIQGRNFDSAVCRRLCEILGIDKTRTAALHPQSDGMILSLPDTADRSPEFLLSQGTSLTPFAEEIVSGKENDVIFLAKEFCIQVHGADSTLLKLIHRAFYPSSVRPLNL